ncbi:urea transporter [Pandoraea pnomenusa]|uniref:urea transporter n=1 Tax=Pandoraea pnomenusa TaxID=93220 RepID=UPI00333E92EE
MSRLSSSPSLPAAPVPPALTPRQGAARWLLDELPALAANFAQIYFIPSAGIGLGLFAVLALADWHAAVTGLAASAAASSIAVVLQLPSGPRRSGLFGYNAALTGVAFGVLWQPGLAFAAWLAVCIGMTVVATAALARRRWPALTGPFVGVMALTWSVQPWLALTPRVGAFACDTGTPGFVFCSVGQVVFIAPLALGLLTWYVLTLWNVRTTLWALAAGIVVWAAIWALAVSWPGGVGQAGGIGVNAFLAALGLGAFGRRPSVRFGGAVLASVFCVMLGAVLGPVGWPYFTLPFNLAVWIVLGLTAARQAPVQA